ncbi:hypothetical protein PRZ48_008419 [Zasmidium cellare]|uniref:Rho GTPase n=1 Tax=Zasmidium cellare TaxID=395010 RepID=A0ABR0EFG8_ZASCE|nr:hypothetical protein PRZ48_008419 [Zasmidium cellare]
MVDGKPRDYKSKESVPDELLGEYIPTAECTDHQFSGTFNGQAANLHFWDTPCIDGWTDEETRAQEAKRAEVYRRADFVLLCFSICSPTSLANVQKKWCPELQRHTPESRVLLLGMKTEFREDWETKEALRKMGMVPTTYQDGEQVAREIDAVQYLECTVIDRESVVRVLETIIRLV